MIRACVNSGSSNKPQATKEDLVLDKAGVGDRKLALKLDRIDRESKAHLRMRDREEKVMRQICRDIHKHRVFDDSSVGKKMDNRSGCTGSRLLPPISGGGFPGNIRRVRSTPNSPTNDRRACSSSPASSRRISDNLIVPELDNDQLMRVRSAGPGMSPAVLHIRRSRSTSNLPGPAGNLPNGHNGAPGIVVYPSKDCLNKQHSNPDISGQGGSLTPHISLPSTPTKHRPWERGLTPARRARTPGELVKLQGVSYLSASQQNTRNGWRLSKSDSNLTGTEKCSEDPRFQKLTSCLVPNSDPEPDNSDSSVDSLNQEMVAIRITSSTPTLAAEIGGNKHGTGVPLPPTGMQPGRLQEPRESSQLPPLKAHHPRGATPSPIIMVDSTTDGDDATGSNRGLAISEGTVRLSGVDRTFFAPQMPIIATDTE